MKDEYRDDEFYDKNLAQLRESEYIVNTASFQRRKFREPSPKETAEEAVLRLKNYLEPFTDGNDPRIDMDELYRLAKAFVRAYEREHPTLEKDSNAQTTIATFN